jgi:hypothetical protein
MTDGALTGCPARLTRPNVGLMPYTPFSAAGMRTDPPPSVPTAKGTAPIAHADGRAAR